MNEKQIARIKAALDRKDIPKWVQTQVFNAICGPDVADPPQLAWKALRAELQAHINSLRSNKSRIPGPLRLIRQEYFEMLLEINARIRTYPTYTPIPQGKERWQEWVPKDTRIDLSNRMRDVYNHHKVRGKRVIPFATETFRADNLERIDRAEAAIAAHRAQYDPEETGRGDTPLKALLLCACRQAEIAIKRYREDLDEGRAHPYETPAKVNWQHYCTAEMRKRVRDALNGEPVSMEGLLTFYQEPTPYA